MANCESCGMPVETGRYCRHCTAEDGTLQPFEERFQAMVAFARARDAGLDVAGAEEQVRAYMRTMPAWADHPSLRE